MFNGFITLLISALPFFKELILGNQTVRAVLLKNKLLVMMALVVLAMFGSVLYMNDAVSYLRRHQGELETQLEAAKKPQVCPPVISPMKPEAIPTPMTLPDSKPVVLPQTPMNEDKDAQIAALKLQLQAATKPPKTKRPKPVDTAHHDALERLYEEPSPYHPVDIGTIPGKQP